MAAPETPVALVRWGTTPRQETLVGTLGDIARRVEETGFRSPAVTVVGEVVRLRETLRWFDTRPLFGKRILVTRAREQASELVALLEELGAEAVEFPVIRTVALEWNEAVGGYDWILFTSANGCVTSSSACRALGRTCAPSARHASAPSARRRRPPWKNAACASTSSPTVTWPSGQ